MTTFTTEDRESAEDEPIIGVCPCDQCDLRDKCADNLWACRAFGMFVLSNKFYYSTPRIPCRGTYKKIFESKEDAKELREYLKLLEEMANAHKLGNNEGE